LLFGTVEYNEPNEHVLCVFGVVRYYNMGALGYEDAVDMMEKLE